MNSQTVHLKPVTVIHSGTFCIMYYVLKNTFGARFRKDKNKFPCQKRPTYLMFFTLSPFLTTCPFMRLKRKKKSSVQKPGQQRDFEMWRDGKKQRRWFCSPVQKTILRKHSVLFMVLFISALGFKMLCQGLMSIFCLVHFPKKNGGKIHRERSPNDVLYRSPNLHPNLSGK